MSGSVPAPFEEIAHTADLALRVWGQDLPQLFVHAAQGLAYLLAQTPDEASTPVVRHIALEAPDLETLLVDWLNELLYLSEMHHEAYCAWEITRLDWLEAGTGYRLEAAVRGWPASSLSRKGIKAATFFGLRLTETETGYQAVITFDV